MAQKVRRVRSFVTVDADGARCRVLNPRDVVIQRIGASGFRYAHSIVAGTERRIREGIERPSREQLLGLSVRGLLEQDGCYALYCNTRKQVKIGKAKNVLRRWSNLETQSGCWLQLVAMWPTSDNSKRERDLHERFADARLIGEWFEPEPVLTWLRERPIDTRPIAQVGVPVDAMQRIRSIRAMG